MIKAAFQLLVLIYSGVLYSQNQIDSILIYNQYAWRYQSAPYELLNPDSSNFPQNDPMIITDTVILAKLEKEINVLKPTKSKCNNDVFMMCRIDIDGNSYLLAFDHHPKIIYYRGACYKRNRKLYKYFLKGYGRELYKRDN